MFQTLGAVRLVHGTVTNANVPNVPKKLFMSCAIIPVPPILF